MYSCGIANGIVFTQTKCMYQSGFNDPDIYCIRIKFVTTMS